MKILKVFKKAWKFIAIDWIIKLLPFKKSIIKVIYDLIFIIMDLLIKYTYFILYIKELGIKELIY